MTSDDSELVWSATSALLARLAHRLNDQYAAAVLLDTVTPFDVKAGFVGRGVVSLLEEAELSRQCRQDDRSVLLDV